MNSARTSAQWWAYTKADPERVVAWLRKQFHGEATAAERIERYCLARLEEGDRRRRALRVIAEQERRHAAWIGELLRARGEQPRVMERGERYWSRVLGAVGTFEEAAGVAHHAEVMRLERIGVIVDDAAAPADVRGVFGRILRDERGHARIFGRLAGAAAIESTRGAHGAGAAAIGFVSAAEAR